MGPHARSLEAKFCHGYLPVLEQSSKPCPLARSYRSDARSLKKKGARSPPAVYRLVPYLDAPCSAPVYRLVPYLWALRISSPRYGYRRRCLSGSDLVTLGRDLVTLGGPFVWDCQPLETSPAQPALPPNLRAVADKAIFKIARNTTSRGVAILDGFC